MLTSLNRMGQTWIELMRTNGLPHVNSAGRTATVGTGPRTRAQTIKKGKRKLSQGTQAEEAQRRKSGGAEIGRRAGGRKDATGLIVLIAALLLAAAGALHHPAGPAAESVKGGGGSGSAALAKMRGISSGIETREYSCACGKGTQTQK